MRGPLAFAAAALGTLSAGASLRYLGDEEGLGSFVAVLALLTVVPVVLSVIYGAGEKATGLAVTALALYVVIGLLAGSAGLYLCYFAATALGLAMTAGEPLPPPDQSDRDRLHAPMPRHEDS